MKPDKSLWSMVWMLCGTATASYICRVNVSIAGPLIMNEFGLSQIEMGQIFSAFLLGYALFQVPAGALTDKTGATRVLHFASWFWVILTILQTLVGWGPIQSSSSIAITVFIFFRFILGIAEAPTFPGAAKEVSYCVLPKDQGRANGIIISAVGLGSAIAPILISNVMVNFGWRASLLISTVPALIIAILWSRFKTRPHVKNINGNADKINFIEASKSLLKSRSFILLTASYTLQGYVGYIFVSWFYMYLVQERHFGMLTGAWMSSLPWILSIISIPFGGIISDYLMKGFLGETWGRRIIPIIGMGLSGILISIGAHTESAIVAAISLAFATALVLCVEGPFWAMMISISGKNSGTGGGIMNMGCNTGGLISPVLTPILAASIGWENALHIAAILSIIAAILWFWIKPKKEIHEI